MNGAGALVVKKQNNRITGGGLKASYIRIRFLVLTAVSRIVYRARRTQNFVQNLFLSKADTVRKMSHYVTEPLYAVFFLVQ